MKFYLQDGIPNNPLGFQESRVFLDEEIHSGCELVRTIDALTWIDARDDVDFL